MGSLVLGGVLGVVGLVGLFLASAAQHGMLYGAGLGLFLLCVLVIFVLIHQRVGR